MAKRTMQAGRRMMRGLVAGILALAALGVSIPSARGAVGQPSPFSIHALDPSPESTVGAPTPSNPRQPQPLAASTLKGPRVLFPAQHGVSQPAGWVAQHWKERFPIAAPDPAFQRWREEWLPLPVPPRSQGIRPGPSGALPMASSLAAPAPASPALPPLFSFEGLNNYDNIIGGIGTQISTPDVNGDVGPSHYVEFVNLVLRVYDKNGNPLSSPFPLSALFASAGFSGPCASANDGDPIVLYDQFADRWFLSQFYIEDVFANTGPSRHCVAVSQTGDPLGRYYVYEFVWPDFPPGSGNHIFMDYPHHAISPEAYWMTAHEFDPSYSPPAYLSQAVAALERNKMLVGDPTARMIYFGYMAAPPSGVDMGSIFGVLAADIEGPSPLPPIGSRPAPGIFLGPMPNEWGFPSDAIGVYKFILDWSNPAAADFVQAATLPVAPFDPSNPSGRDDIPQPGVTTSAFLDSVSGRLMHRVVIRNMGSYSLIGANHTVCAPGLTSTQCQTAGQYQAAVRWYILKYDNATGAVSILDQGTYTGNPPDSHSRWMASGTFDKYGDFCLSYTVSSASVYPGIRYACRTPNDPPGTLGPEATLQAGSAAQTSTASRWGDYSMLSIDPADDVTFWAVHEYYTTSNPSGCSSERCWHTRIGSFRVGRNRLYLPLVVRGP